MPVGSISDKSSSISLLPSGYSYKGISSATGMDSDTDFLATGEITDDLANKIIISEVSIANLYEDTASNFMVQASHDGSTWINVIEITSDIVPNVVGTTTYITNLSDFYAPKWRLVINENALAISSVSYPGTAKINYSIKSS